MDMAVPANMVCGVQERASEAQTFQVSDVVRQSGSARPYLSMVFWELHRNLTLVKLWVSAHICLGFKHQYIEDLKVSTQNHHSDS